MIHLITHMQNTKQSTGNRDIKTKLWTLVVCVKQPHQVFHISMPILYVVRHSIIGPYLP